MMIKNEVYKNG